MVLVASCDAPDELRRTLPEDGAARAVALAGAGLYRDAVLFYREALGVDLGGPGGMGGGPRGGV